MLEHVISPRLILLNPATVLVQRLTSFGQICIAVSSACPVTAFLEVSHSHNIRRHKG